LLVEGRIWTAAEAYDKKLLTRVVPDERLQAETNAAAERIAEGAPLVARWHKQFIRRLTPTGQPLTGDEQAESYAYFDTADYRIGYEAFMQKKKPGFIGR
jgi:enoyl-CoA hydratase/carnithine racemase